MFKELFTDKKYINEGAKYKPGDIINMNKTHNIQIKDKPNGSLYIGIDLSNGHEIKFYESELDNLLYGQYHKNSVLYKAGRDAKSFTKKMKFKIWVIC